MFDISRIWPLLSRPLLPRNKFRVEECVAKWFPMPAPNPIRFPKAPNLDFMNEIEQILAQTHAKAFEFYSQPATPTPNPLRFPRAPEFDFMNEIEQIIPATHAKVLAFYIPPATQLPENQSNK